MAESSGRESLAAAGVRTSWIILAALGCLAFLGATMVGFAFVYELYVPSHPLPPPQIFPAPRLQADPSAEMKQVLAAQRKRLESYGAGAGSAGW